jgi:amidase
MKLTFKRFSDTVRSVLVLLVLGTGLAMAELPEVEELSIDQLQAAYASGQFSVVDVTRAYLDRIERLDRAGPALNSVLTLNPQALEVAAMLDAELAEGRSRGPLHGVPVLLKDNIDTRDMVTTAGSVLLAESLPPADAHIVEMLRAQGAVILGKTNLSEWANFHSSFSSSGWSRLGGQVKNPYALSRNPCGSSAGSAVATAASLATLTIGTETNGSIVCPANANGIVGLKPTVGLWSRSGIIPISHTTDSAGPMTRSVRDAAIVLGLLAAADERDAPTEAAEGHRHVDYTTFLDAGALAGKRIGFYTQPLGNHFRVDALAREMIAVLEAGGAEIIEIERIGERNSNAEAFEVLLHEFRHGMNAYFASLGEASPVADVDQWVARIKADAGETERFDRGLILMAAERGELDSESYLEALAVMLEHSREKGIDQIMDEHQLDAIVAPTGSPAWQTDLTLGDNFKLSSSSPSARAGYPIISVPMGEIDGLPVGVSFFGRAWSEPVLLAIAYAYEQATGHRRPPDLR